MHVVASHLPIADWTAMSAKFDQFAAELKPQYPKLKTAMLTKASDKEAIIFVIFDDFETMQHVSSNVAPWFAENVRPYLASAVSRSVAEVIGGAGYASNLVGES